MKKKLKWNVHKNNQILAKVKSAKETKDGLIINVCIVGDKLKNDS